MRPLLASWLLATALTAAAPVDPGVQPRLAQGQRSRLLVALHPPPEMSIDEAASQVLAALQNQPFRVAGRFLAIPALLLETASREVLAKLAEHPLVNAVGFDDGGYGLLVPPVAVRKLARVAILDIGLPDDRQVGGALKLAGEACVCRLVTGLGCCPDGSAEQNGPNAARQPLAFPTTSLAWLRLPEDGEDKSVVPNHNPLITSIKVLSAGDSFDSWEPVFTALDRLTQSLPGSPQDLAVFSLASRRLYRSCESGAAVVVWTAILRGLQSQGVEPLIARARGGPGAGQALPGCLAAGTPLPAQERYPSMDFFSLSGGGLNSAAPRLPVPPNGSVALGVVEAIRPAKDEEIPPVDTPAAAQWRVVSVQVRETMAAREGQPHLLTPGAVVSFLTYDSAIHLAPRAVVKFSASLMGDPANPRWYASAWRPVSDQ